MPRRSKADAHVSVDEPGIEGGQAELGEYTMVSETRKVVITAAATDHATSQPDQAGAHGDRPSTTTPAAIGDTGGLPGPSRASRLAGHHHPARMRPESARRGRATRGRVPAGRRDPPR